MKHWQFFAKTQGIPGPCWPLARWRRGVCTNCGFDSNNPEKPPAREGDDARRD